MGLDTHWHQVGGLRARLVAEGTRVELADPQGRTIVVDLAVFRLLLRAVTEDVLRRDTDPRPGERAA